MPPVRAKFVPFAMSSASSKRSAFITASTGPKISSWAIAASGCTSVKNHWPHKVSFLRRRHLQSQRCLGFTLLNIFTNIPLRSPVNHRANLCTRMNRITHVQRFSRFYQFAPQKSRKLRPSQSPESRPNIFGRCSQRLNTPRPAQPDPSQHCRR